MTEWKREGRTIYGTNVEDWSGWSATVIGTRMLTVEMEHIAVLMHAAPRLKAIVERLTATYEAYALTSYGDDAVLERPVRVGDIREARALLKELDNA